MATRAQQSYIRPVAAAIAEGATTPNPGTVNAVALSTSGSLMRWTGAIWSAIGAAAGTDASAWRIADPGGASLMTATTPTGLVLITLPVSWNNSMVRMHVRLYNGNTGQSIDVICGGYNAISGSAWLWCFAYILGDANGRSADFPVRFGHDGTKCYISIGDTTTTWSYPSIYVRDVDVSFNGASLANWGAGWSVTISATQPGTVSATVTKTQVGRWLDGLAVVKTNDARLSDTRTPANDAALTHLAGTETLTGAKTFSLPPVVPTPTLNTHAATKAYTDLLMPSGAVLPYAGSAAPTGFLLCDGSLISRATYAGLFTAIGTAYGVGDGSTTFGLPDLRGRLPAGLDAGQAEFAARGQTGGAKAHTHPAAAHTHPLSDAGQAAIIVVAATPPVLMRRIAGSGWTATHSFNPGSLAGAGSGAQTNGAGLVGATDSTTPADTGASSAPLPPYLTLNYIIKT